MQTASQYISVDMAKIEQAYGWLASKQLCFGRFNGNSVFSMLFERGDVSTKLNSYVVTALLENENAKVR